MFNCRSRKTFKPIKNCTLLFCIYLRSKQTFKQTAGYGQVVPQGMTDLWVTIWSQSTGGILFVIFIGYAIHSVESKDIGTNAYRSKISQVRVSFIVTNWQ